jgi:threonyl-tRNA synthetase
MTPLLFKQDLWKQSGHYDNYKEDMFEVSGYVPPDPLEPSSCAAVTHEALGAGLFGLKPMNCPGHCLLFQQMHVNYKELPVRLADFSPLHRYLLQRLD